MRFSPTAVLGAYVVELERREDERGFFARAWCRREFAEHGLETDFVQSNIAFSRRSDTLRGLHYQRPPHEEAKLVRCTRGAMFDVVVDLRADSPTYRCWFGIELTPENGRMLYVPRGCAHGYQTLADETETFYHVTAAYAPEAEAGVRWDDGAFGIEWPPAPERLISPKDASWPDYRAAPVPG
jgi:dTDP-4-dehydrorhamnose 3,5-epimerase